MTGSATANEGWRLSVHQRMTVADLCLGSDFAEYASLAFRAVSPAPRTMGGAVEGRPAGTSGQACMFCGGTGLTQEHVWPRWLDGAVGRKVTFGYRHGTAGSEPKALEWTARGFTHTVGDVCRRCNSGWLSQLESAAKLFLTPMIRGEPQTLGWEQQRIVATWAMKTAAVIDRTHRHRTIPPEHGRVLRERREPPPGIYVWLAAYGVDTFVGTHKGFQFPLGGQRGDAYGATLSIGHLVLQILGLPEEDIEPLSLPSPTLDFIVQVWPIVDGSIRWPPKYAVDDQGLENLSAPPWERSDSGRH